MANRTRRIPANQQPADGGKHVVSSVPGARVADNSKAIRSHIDQSQDHVPAAPQTVGANPTPQQPRKVSDSAAPMPPRIGNWYSNAG